MIVGQMPAPLAVMSVGEARGVEELLHRLIGNLTLVKMWDQLQVPDAVRSHKAFDLVVVQPIRWVSLRVRWTTVLKSTVNSLKRMNGLQSRNSILCSITKNKSKLFRGSKRDADWLSKNWTDSALKNKLVLVQKRRRGDCTNSYSQSMWNFLDNGNKKRLKQSARRSNKKRRVVIDSSRKRKSESVEKKKKPSHKRLNWCKDLEMKWIWSRPCKSRREGKRKNTFKKCSWRTSWTRKRLKETRRLNKELILLLRLSILSYSINKKQTDNMSSNRARKELKISWIL